MTFSHWLIVGGIVLVALLIVGLVAFDRYRKRNPEGAAKVQAAAAAQAKNFGQVIVTDAGAFAVALDGAVDKLLAAKTLPGIYTSTVTTGPAADLEPAKPPAGKLGQPGPLTVQCIGDAAVDVPEFNRLYFQKEAP